LTRYLLPLFFLTTWLTPHLLADYHTYDEADEETQKHLQKEFAEAEKNGWAEGKPGSFLNKLIMHGNRKTEEEFARDAREAEAAKAKN